MIFNSDLLRKLMELTLQGEQQLLPESSLQQNPTANSVPFLHMMTETPQRMPAFGPPGVQGLNQMIRREVFKPKMKKVE